MSDVNNIPEGWVEAILGENLTEIAMGPFGSNLKVDMFTESGVPVIKGGNLLGNFIGGDFSFVSEEKADSLRKSVAYPNDLIITHRGTLGQVSLVPENKYKRYVASQSQIRLSVDTEKLHHRYLLYFFKSRLGQYEILKNASQVGVPAISTPTKSVKEIELTIPSNTNEQKAIAAILTAFDDKIENLQAQNKTLEKTAQTIFKEWFGKYQIGDELPEGWSFHSFYSIGDFINGSAFKSSDFSPNREGLPIVKIAELKNGITKSTAFTKKTVDSKYLINNYDILFSWSGSPKTSIDIFLWTENEAILNQHTFNVKIKDQSKKGWYYFLLKYYKPLFIQLAKMKQTTGLGHVTIANLKEYEFAHPPIFVLEETKVLFSSFYEKIASNQTQIQTLKNTRDTLLPKLMSGAIRVSDFKG